METGGKWGTLNTLQYNTKWWYLHVHCAILTLSDCFFTTDLSPEYEDNHFSSSVSSGFLSSHSESSPLSIHLSTSAPASSGMMLFASFSNDEGIDLDEDDSQLYDVESKDKQVEVCCVDSI